jgi:hypothetical protein
MEIDYSEQIIDRLEALFDEQRLHRPLRIRRYERGTELRYDIQGVIPAGRGQILLEVDRFVGGGFAGQVYKVTVKELRITEGAIPQLEEGQSYALKILVPPSGLGLLFRNIIYGLAFQGPFSPQVNPDAARSGALWQKFIRRGASLRLGGEEAVVDILATLVDPRLGSCGEISEWVDGRMWRFEVDDDLDARRKDGDMASGSPEYLAKKDFMSRLVALMHDMGAHELARQYEWGTCKSQPNALKRRHCDPEPRRGHVAVDFRAGLALLPYLPMCPADFRLIPKGIARGSLVQFDRGNIAALKRFIEENPEAFADMKEALDELEDKDKAYRNSLHDFLHHHFRPLFSAAKKAAIRKSAVRSWRIRNHIDAETEGRLTSKPLSVWGYYLLGPVPFLGKVLRRLLGHTGFRSHYRRLLTSPRYFLRAGRGRIAESLIRWLRSGRVSEERADRLSRSPIRFYAHLPLSFLPPALHRFFSDRRFAARSLRNIFIRPLRLYFKAEEREKWMRDMIDRGEASGMLTGSEADHIRGQIKEPFIQKYLKSLAVHVCTIPVTQIVSVIVAIIYVRLHPEFSWQEASLRAGIILGLFQVTPISPGSIVRGLYVTFLVIKERNFKDYNIAFFLSFFKYIGYLAFPIQMAYRYPDLARFMAGHWATEAVHFIPVFGEHGALLEHAVFDLFYNYPLTIRRRIKERQFLRAGLKPRYWQIPVLALAGAAVLLLASAAVFQFSGRMPKWGDIWWLGIFVPFFTAMAASGSAGGATLPRRLLSGVTAALLAGLIYAFAHVVLASLLPDGALPAAEVVLRQGWLPALWTGFLSAILGMAGAVFIETRRPRSRRTG